MFLRIAFCFIILLPLIVEAKVIETRTCEDLVPFIDEETWLLVDLDNTMFEGKQALGHTEWFYDKAYALMRQTGMSLEEATRECYPEWIEIQKVCPVKPVEEAFIPTLLNFQARKIVMMGLTQRQPSLADSTNRQLLSLGWTFVDSAPSLKSFAVPAETPTMYVHGILFTGEYNKKGEMFVRFLSMIDQKPKKIVFIDDKRSHIEDVERAVTALNIEYVGVHYTAIQHAEKVYFPEIAEFQRNQMKTIMSNEAALLLMQHDLQ